MGDHTVGAAVNHTLRDRLSAARSQGSTADQTWEGADPTNSVEAGEEDELRRYGITSNTTPSLRGLAA